MIDKNYPSTTNRKREKAENLNSIKSIKIYDGSTHLARKNCNTEMRVVCENRYNMLELLTDRIPVQCNC